MYFLEILNYLLNLGSIISDKYFKKNWNITIFSVMVISKPSLDLDTKSTIAC